MKKIFTFLSVMLFTVVGSAQYYQLPFINAGENPGGLNTDEDQTAAYMLANSTGYTQVLNSGDSDWSAGQNLPFSFTFNGNNYNAVYIAPTGVVSFTSSTGVGPGVNQALPSANIPDNSICAWGLDLSGGNDGVIVKTHGVAPNRQYWITWTSASWSQGVGWAYWSIVLEETTNTVYIVDARNFVDSGNGVALTAGLQFDGTTAMMVPGSPALSGTNEASGATDVGPDDNSYYAFMIGTLPDYDGAMSHIDLPYYVKSTGSPISIEATFANLGAITVTDLELTYTINGGTPVVATLSGLNILTGASATIPHPTGWAPSSEGAYQVTYWASKINGNTDPNPANDKANADGIIYFNDYHRTVLYETFTSSTCPPCVAGNANFENVSSNIADNEKASIKYQMSWPGSGDPYNTDDGNVRRSYYNISSVPGMEIDGGWDGNSNSFTMVQHDDAMEVPAFVSLWAEYYVNVADQKLTTCVVIESLQDLGTATLHIVIKEHRTTANTGSNGETEFFDVVKKMVPDANGQQVTITAGMKQEICEEYTFQGSYRLPFNANDIINDNTEHSVEDFTNLGVVAWLQDNSDKVVLNSINAISTPLSIINISQDVSNISVYPNPAVASVTVLVNAAKSGPASIKVIDIVGKTVINHSAESVMVGKNRIVLNTSVLESGIYFVEVMINGGVTTTQLVIQK